MPAEKWIVHDMVGRDESKMLRTERTKLEAFAVGSVELHEDHTTRHNQLYPLQGAGEVHHSAGKALSFPSQACRSRYSP